MRVQLITPPILEPITLAELKLHLRLDSGSFADNIDETQSIAPGNKAIAMAANTSIEFIFSYGMVLQALHALTCDASGAGAVCIFVQGHYI